jgi:hypothetical protein
LPAHETESVVLNAVQDFLGDPQRVAAALKRFRLQARKLTDALEIASGLGAQMDAAQGRRETALKLIKRAIVSDSQLAIEVKLGALMSVDAGVPVTATHRLTIPIDLRQLSGGAIVIAAQPFATPRPILYSSKRWRAALPGSKRWRQAALLNPERD